MTIRKSRTPWLLPIALLLLAVPALAQTSEPLLIRGGTLIDGTGKAPQPGVSILVERGVIVAVGRDLKVPPKARVIDANGKYILPGLIDARVRLASTPANQMSRAELEIPQRLENLRSLLEAGVTTARIIQGDIQDQIFYQRAWRQDLLVGPRLILAGPTLTAPNGHPSEEYSMLAIATRDLQLREISDKYKARDNTRALSEAGVEAFEVVYDAGLHTHPYPRLSKVALVEIILDAHAHHRVVFCAVSTNVEAVDAINAGADAIEGVWQEGLNKNTLALMAKKNVYYMPILSDQGDLVDLLSASGLKAYLDEPIVRKTLSPLYRKSLETPGGVLAWLRKEITPQSAAWTQLEAEEKRAQQSVRDAQAAGVPVIVGTDAGRTLIFPGASEDRELQLMVKAGLSPMQAIVAATRNTAESLGLGAGLGTVAKGKQADLVILPANPLDGIRNFEKVDTVICAGRVVGEEEEARPASNATRAVSH